MFASLRAKRSNPEAAKQELDCFVASLLAMTVLPHAPPETAPKQRLLTMRVKIV
jgi:hypothetical protein